MSEGMRSMEMVLFEDVLDEKVAMALGESSVRAGLLDEECARMGIPAHVGDYLLSVYGDDEHGIREIGDVLCSSSLVDKGMPPMRGDVVCRVSGARRMHGDAYALSTPCPWLFRLGIDGSMVRAEGLLDGSWCHLATSRRNLDDSPAIEVFAEDESTGEFSAIEVGNYSIDGIRVVRGSPASVGRLLDLRSRLSTEEWASLVLRSYGLDGKGRGVSERLCLLSRLAPLAQPGLRVLLVCADGGLRACETSPYEVSVRCLQSEYEGFPGSWDCAVSGGEDGRGAYALSSLLDSYEGMATGVSLAVVSDGGAEGLRRAWRLYGPFHVVVEDSSASSREKCVGTSHLGVDRCLLGELWHVLRGRDLLGELCQASDGIAARLAEEDEETRLAFEGMAKVLCPTGEMTEEEGMDLLEFVLERRQQRVMFPLL